MIGQSLQTVSDAQIIVCFVGLIFITIFIQKSAERAFQKFFPKDEELTSLKTEMKGLREILTSKDKELEALKRGIADLREIMLVIAVQSGVDVAEFKALAGRG
jgi:hypothetical protein